MPKKSTARGVKGTVWRCLFLGIFGGWLGMISLWAEPVAEGRKAAASATREEAAQALAEVSKQRRSPEEIVARKQALLAALPRPTPVARREAPVSARAGSASPAARRNPASLSEPERLRAEFGEAMSQARSAGGCPEQIVGRKAALLAANAETLEWTRTALAATRERSGKPSAAKPRSPGERSPRQQLAATIAGIWRQEATPEQRIARLAKFQHDKQAAFRAAQRPFDQPAAPTPK